ncbi:hypothetical protein TNCT_270311 [Trichonephila clavata]|uniref:CCHC-type domain-containing protein n=1 Tax=Trichonephila clavata TaxID=2740835 RepID=A0A8X6GQ53_TRICU|nr:hypothetical protein TNCT_270311 [Trichonephila clavata]
MFSVQKSRIKCHYCGKFGHFKRECRYGSTAASSGAPNRRYIECRTPSPKLRRHPVLPFPVGSSISSDKCIMLFEVVDKTEVTRLKLEKTQKFCNIPK